MLLKQRPTRALVGIREKCSAAGSDGIFSRYIKPTVYLACEKRPCA